MYLFGNLQPMCLEAINIVQEILSNVVQNEYNVHELCDECIEHGTIISGVSLQHVSGKTYSHSGNCIIIFLFFFFT